MNSISPAIVGLRDAIVNRKMPQGKFIRKRTVNFRLNLARVPWLDERSSATTVVGNGIAKKRGHKDVTRGKSVAIAAKCKLRMSLAFRLSFIFFLDILLLVIERRIHRKSWDEPWDIHCLTFSTFRRQPFFPGRHTAEWFLQSLTTARLACPFYLFAYVIMPEHVHIILQPAPGVKIRTVLWQLKYPVATRALTWVKKYQPDFLEKMRDIQPSGKTTHRFWQRGGGYDRNLRRVSDVQEKITYIHENPLRRGLVSNLKDWPYSSVHDWLGKTTGRVPIDWEHMPEAELR